MKMPTFVITSNISTKNQLLNYKKITAHADAFVTLEKGVESIKKGGCAFYTDGSHGYLIARGTRSVNGDDM